MEHIFSIISAPTHCRFQAIALSCAAPNHAHVPMESMRALTGAHSIQPHARVVVQVALQAPSVRLKAPHVHRLHARTVELLIRPHVVVAVLATTMEINVRT